MTRTFSLNPGGNPAAVYCASLKASYPPVYRLYSRVSRKSASSRTDWSFAESGASPGGGSGADEIKGRKPRRATEAVEKRMMSFVAILGFEALQERPK